MFLRHSEFIESFSSSYPEDSNEFKYFYGLVTNSLLFHLLGRLNVRAPSLPLFQSPIRISSLSMGREPQTWPCGPLEPEHSGLCGTVLWIIRCLAAPMASTHLIPTTPNWQPKTSLNITKHSPGHKMTLWHCCSIALSMMIKMSYICMDPTLATSHMCLIDPWKVVNMPEEVNFLIVFHFNSFTLKSKWPHVAENYHNGPHRPRILSYLIS